jgi:serine protease Do
MLASLLLLLAFQPPDDLDAALESSTKAALNRIAPCVVQVRTVGGAEFVGKRAESVQRGTGPTTGLIVSADGYILSSSFNFANKPAAITVMIPGRKEPLAAKVIAADETRMLTLLKVDASGLPTPIPAPKKDIRIGQWAMAVGRTWSDTQNTAPSASIGIISALDRVWGKAVQTDAKVSPVNYGGPRWLISKDESSVFWFHWPLVVNRKPRVSSGTIQVSASLSQWTMSCKHCRSSKKAKRFARVVSAC